MSTSRNAVSLEQRVQKAAKVMKITEDELWAGLGEMGIGKGDEDALELIEAETTTEADAQKAFCGQGPDHHVPAVRIRAGWAILRDRQNDEKPTVHAEITASSFVRPITQYKDEELIGAYGEECSSDILDELNRRSSGRPFVVFDEGGKVDAEMSIRMLRIARRQPTSPQHVVMKDGKSVSLRLHPVGAFPTFWVEECPIHPDVILVDGYCEECDETFDGISEGNRKAIRIYADVVGSAVMDRQFVHDMLERVRKDGSGYLLELPAAFRRFNELEEIERLPVLRRRPSSAGGKKDPFYMHNRI
jgi:hypothetical protein